MNEELENWRDFLVSNQACTEGLIEAKDLLPNDWYQQTKRGDWIIWVLRKKKTESKEFWVNVANFCAANVAAANAANVAAANAAAAAYATYATYAAANAANVAAANAAAAAYATYAADAAYAANVAAANAANVAAANAAAAAYATYAADAAYAASAYAYAADAFKEKLATYIRTLKPTLTF